MNAPDSLGHRKRRIKLHLNIIKRAYTLALRAGKLLPAHRPHITMRAEHNIRTGFFEPDQFAALKGHLRAALRPVAEFAYLTCWRVQSDVLPLEWWPIRTFGKAWRSACERAGCPGNLLHDFIECRGRGSNPHAPKGTGF